jgi:PII-like signaling protein
LTPLPERCERLSILLVETDRHAKLPVYVEFVERARHAGLAGAIVTEGISGFGQTGRVHHRHTASHLDDVPVEVTIVESPERLDEFLLKTGDLLEGALVVRSPVRVVSQRDRLHRGPRS